MLTHHGITYAALALPPSAVGSPPVSVPRLRVTIGLQHGSWHVINEESSNKYAALLMHSACCATVCCLE